MRIRHAASALGALTLLAILGAGAGCASSEPDGFAEPVETLPRSTPDDELASRHRDVRLDVEALRGEPGSRISVALFDGEPLELELVERAPFGEQGFTWTGTAIDDRATTAIFAVEDGVLVGQVRTASGLVYRFVPIDERIHRLLEIDPKRLPWDCAASREDEVRRDHDPNADTCGSDPPTEVDILVLYTDDARSAAGGHDAMRATIYLAVAETNQTYQNSGVDHRLRLVHTSEISYAESGSSVTDLDRLEDLSDGQLDDAHTLRDAHAADIVLLFTESMEGTVVGRARIMATVSSAFDASAFGVVKRANATGNFTFGHEVGHIMGARHDWAGDSANNAPFEFNHGHSEPSPTPAGVPAWRTVMARNSLGGNRLPFWSNPNLDFPAGDPNADPMGVATGAQQTDNTRTLNSTAPTVANFRCSSPSADSVWMKDTWNDTGAEPDPATAGEPMWRSPYIWVRNAEDTNLLNEHVHQDPISGQPNFVYAKLHNGFGVTTSGDLEFYVADASSSLTWPTGWSLVGAVAVSGFDAHETRIVGQEWTPAGTGHYCMIARWNSAADPMAVPEGADIGVNVRANNNLVWRNLNVIDLGADESADASFLVGNPDRQRRMDASLVVRSPEGRPAFAVEGRLSLSLDGVLSRAWAEGGERSFGIERIGDTLVVAAEHAGLEGLVLPPGAQGRIRVRFEKLDTTPKAEFEIDFTQLRDGKIVVGGVSYEIDTRIGGN